MAAEATLAMSAAGESRTQFSYRPARSTKRQDGHWGGGLTALPWPRRSPGCPKRAYRPDTSDRESGSQLKNAYLRRCGVFLSHLPMDIIEAISAAWTAVLLEQRRGSTKPPTYFCVRAGA